MQFSYRIRRSNRRSNHRSDRRGTLYIAVLGVTLIVAVMAAVGMSVARTELRMSQNLSDQQEARLLARSAVEHAVNWTQQTNDWRTKVTNDTFTPQRALGRGLIRWKFIDSDGDLNDNDNDRVTLYGYGTVGDATAVEAVTLGPVGGIGLSCLEVALLSENDIVLPSGNISNNTIIQTDQVVASNGDIDASANNAQVQGNAEAAGTVSGTVSGTSTSSVPTREMPSSTAFDYYLANGTPIAFTDLPFLLGKRWLWKILLSPNNNPYGSTNPEGIYIIDCEGDTLDIRQCRVVGTLVLIDVGSNTCINGTVHFGPAVANYPTLLVQGDMVFDMVNIGGATELSESILGVNFNPPGTPYQGSEDSDTSDTYPAGLYGLVYVSEKSHIKDDSRIEGCFVTDEYTMQSNKTLTVNYNDTYLNNPPPGFSNGSTLGILPGTWRREAND